VLLFVAHASIQRARVARFALPRVTSFSAFGSGSDARWCSCVVFVVGKDEELPTSDAVEKYAEVAAARDGAKAAATVCACVWIVGLVAGFWGRECGTTAGAVVGSACGLRRRLWTDAPTAVMLLAPKGLGLLLLNSTGWQSHYSKMNTCSSAWESSTDARMEAAQSRTVGTDCTNVQSTLRGIVWGGLGSDGGVRAERV
jgi:hypothetical protein